MKFIRLTKLTTKEVKVGDFVYKRCGKKIKELGCISKFLINPFDEQESIMIEGNNKSMYRLKQIYIKL